tara:strand:+ start:4497 stop:5921 length:1425 start_codon:yes stop_codon:yes gene_type:complete
MKTLITSKSPITFLFISALWLFQGYGFAQVTSHNSPYSLELTNGISFPQSDLKNYADNGFNSGFIIEKQFCNQLAVSLDSRFTSLPIHNSFDISNKTWKSTTFNVGPQYSIDKHSFSMDFYGRMGISIISVPEIHHFYANSNIVNTQFDQAKTSHLNARIGINLGYTICNSLFLYANPEYYSTITGGIHYGQRDLSKAVDPSGNIDPDLANDIAYNHEQFSISTFNINFGIRFNITKNNNNTRATDYNSSRSNRSTSAIAPNPDNGNNGDGSNTRATDYNSSRSNRTTSAFSPDPDNGNNSDSNNTRATDYNSSRSNRSTSAIAPNPDNGNNGDSSNTRATDYNSSRSNRTTSAFSPDPNNGNNGDSSNTRATDYNSSRSNRSTSAIAPNPNNETQRIESKGRLLGIFISSRKFEFEKDNGELITGSINSSVSRQQLTQYSQRYLNKSCTMILNQKNSTVNGSTTFEMLEITKH